MFGEDELAQRMIDLDDDEMLKVWRTAATYLDPSFQLPNTGKATNSHVMVFACMKHLEGSLRPLARQRRRPGKSLPADLAEAGVEKDEHLPILDKRLRGIAESQ